MTLHRCLRRFFGSGNARAWLSRRSPNLAINSECWLIDLQKASSFISLHSKKGITKRLKTPIIPKVGSNWNWQFTISFWFFCVLLSCVWIAKPVCKKTMVSVRSLHFDFRKAMIQAENPEKCSWFPHITLTSPWFRFEIFQRLCEHLLQTQTNFQSQIN